MRLITGCGWGWRVASMAELQPPDTHYLNAALGWLELGNPSEAGEEIARISPEALDTLEVLDVRWRVCAATGSWATALTLGEHMVQKFPDEETGWIHRAYAARRTPGGGLAAAYEALEPAFERFPDVPVIPYNLACYTAQMGRLDEAWDWLTRAFARVGSSDVMRQMALADSDLQPLWERIRAMP